MDVHCTVECTVLYNKLTYIILRKFTKLLKPAAMLSTTIHHVATLHRRPLTNASHFIYRCSSEVARQQVEPSIVNTSPTYGGAPESSATGLPQLQVILRNSSDNGSRHSRNLRRGPIRCCITESLEEVVPVFLVFDCLS